MELHHEGPGHRVLFAEVDGGLPEPREHGPGHRGPASRARQADRQGPAPPQEERIQQLVFTRVVEVQRTGTHPGPARDLRYRGSMEALFDKQRESGVLYCLAFVDR